MDTNNVIVCPHCNATVLNFDECDFRPCKHTMLVYNDMVGDEFVHINPSMRNVASEMEQTSKDTDESLSECLEKYAEKNKEFSLLTLTTHGMACGPVTATDYILFKQD